MPTRRPRTDTDQHRTIALLSTPATYGGNVASVTRIDTHSAVVFLAGPRAYKLKRAVRYDYLDFTTVDRRGQACADEVRLNRRTAPGLYLGRRPVTLGPHDDLALDGDGVPVDWVVEMTRFDQRQLFDRLAARTLLPLDLMPLLAQEVARLHAVAEWRFDHGGRRGMAWVIDGNDDGFGEYGPGTLDPEVCRRVTSHGRELLERHSDLLMARRRQGFVRRCHGDLHLRNVCLFEGRPTLFDCIEFSDEVACIDVMYDLAFLVMDLIHRGLYPHAQVVYDQYVAATGDIEGAGLLPLFLSTRAAVRAKVGATTARLESAPDQKGRLAREARSYLDLALDLLTPAPARLVAIGGLSGTGKSTLARHLAPGLGAAPGALVLRSDLIRKSLLGVQPHERLASEGYAEGITRSVYRQLAERARRAVAAGRTVIVDATFADPRDRAVMTEVASALGARFSGLWLEAPLERRSWRVSHRHDDASDATPAVLAAQEVRDVGTMEWPALDASGDEPALVRDAQALLGLHGG